MERLDQEPIQHETVLLLKKRKRKLAKEIEGPTGRISERTAGHWVQFGKYDLYVVKDDVFPVLVKEEAKFTINQNNNLMCLKTEHLCFLDIINFLVPGFTNDKFVKAYACLQTKGFFPYERIDSLDKLDSSSLPPHEAFYSSLEGCNISVEEYQYCQRVWKENNMNINARLSGVI